MAGSRAGKPGSLESARARPDSLDCARSAGERSKCGPGGAEYPALDALTAREGGREEKGAYQASQLPAPGREVNGHSHRMFCSLHLAMSIYGSNHSGLNLGHAVERRATRNVCGGPRRGPANL